MPMQVPRVEAHVRTLRIIKQYAPIAPHLFLDCGVSYLDLPRIKLIYALKMC